MPAAVVTTPAAARQIFALIPLGADGKAAGQPILVGAGPLDGSNW